MNKILFEELKKRFEEDQKLLRGERLKEWDSLRKENSLWLKEIVDRDGWVSNKIVGEQGELYAWLIVQHSDDLSFQKYCLEQLKVLPVTKERMEHIMYLTDRILIKEGKHQIYGTQKTI